MKQGWDIKQWKDVLEVRSGRNQTEIENHNGKYPILGSAGKTMGFTDDYICEEGTTILGRKGTIDNPLYIESKFWNVDTAFGLHALVGLDKRFLYYFCLSYDFTKQDKGSGRPSLVKTDLLKIEIPLPTLSEQQFIVAILDEAFDSIAKAKANAEQNIKNAKELFESYLQALFTKERKDWETKKIGEVIKLEYGKPLPNDKRNQNGAYPIYGANGEKGRTDEFYHNKKTIIVGRKGSAGELNLTEEKFWPLDVTYFVTFDEKRYDVLFLYHLLSLLKLQKLAKGVKPGINRNEVYSLDTQFPSLPEQKFIVQKLNDLSIETKKLDAIYKQKLNDLEELKKSILQKAFNGELKTTLSVLK